MKNRRRNPIILQYLPFHEVENADAHLEESNKNIIERLKRHSMIDKKNFFPILNVVFCLIHQKN